MHNTMERSRMMKPLTNSQILEELGIEGEIIKKGAEAALIKSKWMDADCLIKYRLKKKYRIEQIDNDIRKHRTSLESRALIAAKKAGVPTPKIFDVNDEVGYIIMEFLEGDRLKDLVISLSQDERKDVFKRVGQYAARLHKANLIHGDLTTSNIMISKELGITIIDFGLDEHSTTQEDMAVDLHLFKRVIVSTHGKYFEDCFPPFSQGYCEEFGEGGDLVIDRIHDIELRGRYVPKTDRPNRKV